MSIFDRVNGTPINEYNLVEAGFERLAHYDSSSSSYAVDRSGSYQFYYQKPVIINKTLIGFAKYENGEFRISDHLLKYGEFKFEVETIEDIVDIIINVARSERVTKEEIDDIIQYYDDTIGEEVLNFLKRLKEFI